MTTLAARRWLLLTGALAPVVAAGPILLAWIGRSTAGYILPPDQVPPSRVALVLGAGIRGGEPTRYLAERLQAARQLYAAGTVDAILCSGDGRFASHDEPAAMRRWLLRAGIPDSAISCDPYGLDTRDSCLRARDIYGLRSLIVVSHDYHLPRAVFIARHSSIAAFGTGPRARGGRLAAYRRREKLASMKAILDWLRGRDPAIVSEPPGGLGRIVHPAD